MSPGAPISLQFGLDSNLMLSLFESRQRSDLYVGSAVYHGSCRYLFHTLPHPVHTGSYKLRTKKNMTLETTSRTRSWPHSHCRVDWKLAFAQFPWRSGLWTPQRLFKEVFRGFCHRFRCTFFLIDLFTYFLPDSKLPMKSNSLHHSSSHVPRWLLAQNFYCTLLSSYCEYKELIIHTWTNRRGWLTIYSAL